MQADLRYFFFHFFLHMFPWDPRIYFPVMAAMRIYARIITWSGWVYLGWNERT